MMNTFDAKPAGNNKDQYNFDFGQKFVEIPQNYPAPAPAPTQAPKPPQQTFDLMDLNDSKPPAPQPQHGPSNVGGIVDLFGGAPNISAQNSLLNPHPMPQQPGFENIMSIQQMPVQQQAQPFQQMPLQQQNPLLQPMPTQQQTIQQMPIQNSAQLFSQMPIQPQQQQQQLPLPLSMQTPQQQANTLNQMGQSNSLSNQFSQMQLQQLGPQMPLQQFQNPSNAFPQNMNALNNKPPGMMMQQQPGFGLAAPQQMMGLGMSPQLRSPMNTSANMNMMMGQPMNQMGMNGFGGGMQQMGMMNMNPGGVQNMSMGGLGGGMQQNMMGMGNMNMGFNVGMQGGLGGGNQGFGNMGGMGQPPAPLQAQPPKGQLISMMTPPLQQNRPVNFLAPPEKSFDPFGFCDDQVEKTRATSHGKYSEPLSPPLTVFIHLVGNMGFRPQHQQPLSQQNQFQNSDLI